MGNIQEAIDLFRLLLENTQKELDSVNSSHPPQWCLNNYRNEYLLVVPDFPGRVEIYMAKCAYDHMKVSVDLLSRYSVKKENLRFTREARELYRLATARDKFYEAFDKEFPQFRRSRDVIHASWLHLKEYCARLGYDIKWGYSGGTHDFGILSSQEVKEKVAPSENKSPEEQVPRFHIRKGLRTLDTYGFPAYMYLLSKMPSHYRHVVSEEVQKARPQFFTVD